MDTNKKYQIRFRKRTGDFSLLPEDMETIAQRILMGENHDIDLRLFLDGDEIEARHKDDWKDWREFSAVVSFIKEIQDSPKYHFLSKELQGYIPIEEIRILKKYLNNAMIFDPQSNSWELLDTFWKLKSF